MCWGPYFSQKNLKSENGPTLLLFNKISKKSYIGQRKGPAHGGRRGGCILVCKAACAMYILENILEYESARDPLYSQRYSRIIRRTQRRAPSGPAYPRRVSIPTPFPPAQPQEGQRRVQGAHAGPGQLGQDPTALKQLFSLSHRRDDDRTRHSHRVISKHRSSPLAHTTFTHHRVISNHSSSTPRNISA